jgi:hypothetical protein
MEFTVEGKIKDIMNERGGVSKKTGKEWMGIDFLLISDSGQRKDGSTWENVIRFECGTDMARAVKEYRKVGDVVKVTFNIYATEWEGRWFNKLSPSKVEKVEKEPSHDPVDDVTMEQAQKAMAQTQPQQLDAFGDAPSDDGSDKLPF